MARIYILPALAPLAETDRTWFETITEADAKHDRMLQSARREAEYVATFYHELREHKVTIELAEQLTRRWFNAALCTCPACNG